MDDHRLPKRIKWGELEYARKRASGGKGEECTECVVEDRRVFGITGDWSTAFRTSKVVSSSPCNR